MMTSTFGNIPKRDRIAWIALSLYLFVLPIAGTTGLRNLAFLFLIFWTLLLLLRDKIRPELPFPLYWLAYTLIAANSAFFAVSPDLSWSELRVEVIYWIIVIVVGVTWGRRLTDFRIPALILVIINGILTTSAFYFVSLDMEFGAIQRVPPIAYAGLDGNWLLIVIFLSCWLAWREWVEGSRALPYLLIALVALDIWAMIATQNRQNLVALGGGIIAAGLFLLARNFSWRRALAYILILMLAASLIMFQMLRRGNEVISVQTDGNTFSQAFGDVGEYVGAKARTDIRWEIWRFSLEKIAEHPLIGGGIGRGVFDKLYPDFMPEDKLIWHAHNMIINKGIQMGFPGMLAFVALWFALVRELFLHATKTRSHVAPLAIAGFSAVIAIFTKNMTDDFFVRNNALFFWLVIGLLIGYLRVQAAETERK